MKKIKITFFEIKEKWQIELLQKELPKSRYSLVFTKARLTSGNARNYSDSEIISVFVNSIVDKKVLSYLPRLRFVATNSTGFDHIDLAECKRKKIKVSNVPFYGENTVAEHTFALILALSRKMVRAVNRTKRGSLARVGLRGFDLKGKTLGVIGTGHIGQHVIRMAHGFEMKMLTFDIKKDHTLEDHYPLKYVSMEKLLCESDIVSLHAPYNQATHHLINKNNLKLFKKSALLINTARGGLIDSKALLSALQRGQIAGAGLDVLEEEGAISEDSLAAKDIDRKELQAILAGHRLMSLDNVIVTPHNAFNSEEAVNRIICTAIWYKVYSILYLV